MRVLIAEDDAVSRTFLAATLRKWDYDVSTFPDGSLVWQELESGEVPELLILDWMMPGVDGLEVCRRVRQKFPALPVYIILLTARAGREDVVRGLLGGADDYITKPFDREELRARVQVGRRVIELQKALAGRVGELENALKHIQQLQGLLPICSYCKRVRNDRNYWQQIETYVSEHSEAQFSHGICPDCWEKVVKPELEREKLEGGRGL
jgi:sigma-B regulation protein RsbU (phosphoserine phosphatase)